MALWYHWKTLVLGFVFVKLASICNYKQSLFRAVTCCIRCPSEQHSWSSIIFTYINDIFHFNILSKLFIFANDTKKCFMKVMSHLDQLAPQRDINQLAFWLDFLHIVYPLVLLNCDVYTYLSSAQ